MIDPPLRYRLEDMRDYAREAVEALHGDLVPSERMRELALERLISIVGEAASKVPAEVRALAPEIDWPKVVGMRHVLVHDYSMIKKDVVIDVVTHRLPSLILAMERLLAEGENDT
jgi:uncharacterized protein with HEPN domain